MSVSLAYFTREPAVNRRYQITANRLCLHATTTEQALATLAEVHPHWPQSHPVFLSTMRLAPTPGCSAGHGPKRHFSRSRNRP